MNDASLSKLLKADGNSTASLEVESMGELGQKMKAAGLEDTFLTAMKISK